MTANHLNSETDGFTDKRYFPRWDVANKIHYRFEGQEIPTDALTKDLSCTGTCIVTAQPLPIDEKIKLVIKLADGNTAFVTGRVVWSRLWSSGHENGVMFTEMTEKMRQTILENAYELNQRDVYEHWFKGWDGQKP